MTILDYTIMIRDSFLDKTTKIVWKKGTRNSNGSFARLLQS